MPDFDFLARHYNAMTGYPGRIDNLAQSIRPWVERWGTQQALDAGCGGGALMLALDRLGVSVTGTDNSEAMLKLAADNAREQGRDFQLEVLGHEEVGTRFPAAFDTVFSLGNAIIGASNDDQMVRWLTGLRGALRPGGHLLIQILNLTPFLTGKKVLINRRMVDRSTYIRVARPAEDRLGFCALCIAPDDTVDAHVGLWERWEGDRVERCVGNSGFDEVQVYGGLDRSSFDPAQSTDVVIAARNSA